jgi:GT2 family glycosyltransferase
MKKVGLVTVLYKSDDVLEDFFKSISSQSFENYHLYLVDNSSSSETDNVVETLAKKYPITDYTHIKNEANNGVAKGNNQGMELSIADGCDFVLLLNNDIEFSQTRLLENMVSYAVDHNEHLLIPKIFYYGTRKIWLAGGLIHKYKGYVSHVGDNEDDSEKYNTIKHFEYAPTCFMLISKEVLAKVGLMDQKYFVYYDDTDYLARAVHAGFKVCYLPTLEVFHKVSFSTGGGESLFSIYYLNRNRIYFIRKNYSFFVRQIALSHTMITRGIRYLLYNKEQKASLFKGVKDGFALGNTADKY